MAVMRIGRMIALGVAVLALGVGACNSKDNGGVDLHLDSAGSKIERGVNQVGRKLDTAWTDVKTNVNEAQIQSGLHSLNGMDSVEVDLTSSGDVTLTGTVASDNRRQLAETIARETKGVRSVSNRIAVGAMIDSTIADTTGNSKTYTKPNTKHPLKP
jgi:osmotically-inducible protein OsmY